MDVLSDSVFTALTSKGITRVSLNELFDLCEAGDLRDLPRAFTHMRPGIRTMLGSLLALRNAYGSLADLGEDLWRVTGPDDEPAFFQSPVGPAELTPVALGDVGPTLRGPDHVIKPIYETDDPEPWLWELITSTMRPFARYPSGLRAGVVSACPSDGTIGSEILSVARATRVEHSSEPRDHLIWYRIRGRGLEPSVGELPSPVLDAPRIVRLHEENGKWSAAVGAGTTADMRCLSKDSTVVDPTSGTTTDGKSTKPLRAFGSPLGAFDVIRITSGMMINPTKQTLAAEILRKPSGLPFVLVDAMAGGQGGSEGYRARYYPLGEKSRLRLGRQVASQLAKDILAAQGNAHWCLKTALTSGGFVRQDEKHNVVGGLGNALSGLDNLDGEAGWKGTELLFELLDLDLPPDEQAHRINLAMREITLKTWERILPTLDPVDMGKAETALQRTMNAKLPVKSGTPHAAA
jgi:hypothetical protein